jgi:hypothetical protein
VDEGRVRAGDVEEGAYFLGGTSHSRGFCEVGDETMSAGITKRVRTETDLGTAEICSSREHSKLVMKEKFMFPASLSFL